MKNLKMFAIGLAAMTAMTMSVSAHEFKGEDANQLATCLQSTETSSVCTLTKSASITGSIDVTKDVTLNLGKDVVLDFTNGNINVKDGGSLTINGGEIKRTHATYANLIVVEEGGALKADNTKLTSTVTNADHDYQSVIAVLGGTKTTKVSIGKDTEVEGYAGLIVYPAARTSAGQADNVTIDLNGTWHTTSYTIQNSGRIKNTGNGPVINVNSGSYTSDNNAVFYASGLGNWTIADGVKVEGTEALFVRSSKVTVNGGTFTSTRETCSVGTTVGGTPASHSEQSGAAITVDYDNAYAGHATVVVNGGTFKTEKCSAVIVRGAVNSNEVTLKGGNYIVGDENQKVVDSNISGIVAGGTYNKALPADNYLAASMKTVTVNGITYVGKEFKVTTTVTEENGKKDEITSPVNRIAGVEFAIADFVKVTPDDGYVAVYKVTDTEGNEITVTDGKFVMPESDVNVTVTFVEKAAAVTPGDNTGSGDTTEQEPPKTGDNIMAFVGLGIASLAVVGLGTKNLKKQTN